MANAEGSDHMLNRVMPRDNIGLAALLRTKEAAWDNGKMIFFSRQIICYSETLGRMFFFFHSSSTSFSLASDNEDASGSLGIEQKNLIVREKKLQG